MESQCGWIHQKGSVEAKKGKMTKEEMIDKLEKAKDIVSDVWHETDIDKVGDVLCAIDEAVNAVEEFEGEQEEWAKKTWERNLINE